jgi:uncharacterized membrane protein YphA (DoxX/SURF4 family)
MFPHGGPGVGLLLLRLATAILVINELVTRFETMVFHWIFVAVMILAACLVVGFMTPITSTVGLILQIAYLLSPNRNGEAALAIAFALAFLALILLGPGAYSADGYLFGRRVLVRPDENE